MASRTGSVCQPREFSLQSLQSLTDGHPTHASLSQAREVLSYHRQKGELTIKLETKYQIIYSTMANRWVLKT